MVRSKSTLKQCTCSAPTPPGVQTTGLYLYLSQPFLLIDTMSSLGAMWVLDWHQIKQMKWWSMRLKRDRLCILSNVRVIYLLMIIACFALVITHVILSRFLFLLLSCNLPCIAQKKKEKKRKTIVCFAFAYKRVGGMASLGCGVVVDLFRLGIGGGTIMSRASPLMLVSFFFCRATH